MTWFQGVTLGVALLGAVLGIINIWHQLSRDRIRIRVTPQVAHRVTVLGISGPTLCVEVVNLSAFPVTISDVGFSQGSLKKPRLTIINPILIDGKPWPRKLEPRETVTAYCSEEIARHPDMKRMTRAYAKTACGEVRHGDSPALRQFLLEALRV